jgi:hypothetical protein
MNDPTAFAKLVPGFDFLQGLVKNAGAALPGIGQWVAPTIDPAELEKRIEELRTVQFWLEQNARMLGATIQALEVQRMTLSTLKTMNVQMEGLRDSLQIRMPTAAARVAATPESEGADDAGAEPEAEASAPASNPGVVDPMKWWGALTQQFTQLATSAMKGGAEDAARTMAAAMAKPPPPEAKDAALAATNRTPAAKKKTPATKKTAAPAKRASRA